MGWSWNLRKRKLVAFTKLDSCWNGQMTAKEVQRQRRVYFKALPIPICSPAKLKRARQHLVEHLDKFYWRSELCQCGSCFVAGVATAFLQGDRQEKAVWRKLPRDICECLDVPQGSLMRLSKPICGQADAPLQWFRVARRRLQECGYSIVACFSSLKSNRKTMQHGGCACRRLYHQW